MRDSLRDAVGLWRAPDSRWLAGFLQTSGVEGAPEPWLPTCQRGQEGLCLGWTMRGSALVAGDVCGSTLSLDT